MYNTLEDSAVFVIMRDDVIQTNQCETTWLLLQDAAVSK